jgi:hypothetical protein
VLCQLTAPPARPPGAQEPAGADQKQQASEPPGSNGAGKVRWGGVCKRGVGDPQALPACPCAQPASDGDGKPDGAAEESAEGEADAKPDPPTALSERPKRQRRAPVRCRQTRKGGAGGAVSA